MKPSQMKITLAVAATLIAQNASAFTLISEGMRGWNRDTLKFFVNTSGCTISADQVKEAVEDAIDVWNSVPTMGLKLEMGGDTSTTVADAYNGAGTDDGVIVACSTGFGALTGADEDLVIGVGRPFTNSNGEITKAGLILNATASADGNIANVQSGEPVAALLAHEIGHTLGLGHTADANSLMYPSLQRHYLRLSQDDMDGISYLYPREEPSDGFYGCATVQGGTGGASGSGTALLTLLGFFLLARWATRVRKALPPANA